MLICRGQRRGSDEGTVSITGIHALGVGDGLRKSHRFNKTSFHRVPTVIDCLGSPQSSWVAKGSSAVLQRPREKTIFQRFTEFQIPITEPFREHCSALPFIALFQFFITKSISAGSKWILKGGVEVTIVLQIGSCALCVYCTRVGAGGINDGTGPCPREFRRISVIAVELFHLMDYEFVFPFAHS